MTDRDSGPESAAEPAPPDPPAAAPDAEPPSITRAGFAELAQRLVAGEEDRFIATLTPAAIPALAGFARQHAELASLASELDYADDTWPAEGVQYVRVSARWAELQQWAAETGWRVVRMKGVVRQSPVPGGPTGPVFWMQRAEPTAEPAPRFHPPGFHEED